MDNDSNWGCGCLCLIFGAFIIGAIANSGSKSSSSTKSTPTNTYQAPKPTYTPHHHLITIPLSRLYPDNK